MKRVLIIGAGYLQSFVIRKAKELGYVTYAVDGNPNAMGFQFADHFSCINIVDADACLAYARVHRIDGVLTAATEYGVLTAAHIADRMGLPGIPPEVAKRMKNKYQVRQCLYENHVDDAERAFEVTEDTDIRALMTTLDYPVMVKPCDGSGSRGASRVNSSAELAEACRYAMMASNLHRAEIETFVDGQEYGVESFVDADGVHVLAVMKKWMTKPPYYAELGHAFPADIDEELKKTISARVVKAIEVLGITTGAVNMDILVSEDNKVYIVDVGARMGGNLIGSHIVPLGTGIDYIKNIICAAVGDDTDLIPGKENNVATRLLALTPGKVKSLPDFGALEQEYGVRIEHHLHEGEIIMPYRTNLDGCGYVVAVRDDLAEAIAVADAVKARIDQMIERV